ncbi:outer membrane lipoprotein carrier protein LolA [Candidatus Pelagibacter sp.]|nr:outer membrane lipoprotein carrier protein LolA [Candidatus Pelagibacter sp.]
MKYIIFILIFFYPLNVFASSKELIKNKLNETDNISFKFTQKIGKKTERGDCIISYPKKILCKYDDIYNKILVSNGRSLVINSQKITNYLRYQLKNTPLNLILDKKFLLEKLDQVETIKENNETFSFKIVHNNNLLNIFFDKISYEIKGWTTTDIYLNEVETKLSNVEINIMIDERIFRVQNYIN